MPENVNIFQMSHNQRVKFSHEILKTVQRMSTQNVAPIVKSLLDWNFHKTHPYADNKKRFNILNEKALKLAIEAGEKADNMDSGEELSELGKPYQQAITNESCALILMSVLRFYYFNYVACLSEAKDLYLGSLKNTENA